MVTEYKSELLATSSRSTNAGESYFGNDGLKFDGFGGSSLLKAANSLRLVAQSCRVTNSIGADKPTDCFKFRLKRASQLTLRLAGLTADADVVLLNAQGRVISTSLNSYLASERIQRSLGAGTYYIEVHTEAESARYSLAMNVKKLKGDAAQAVAADTNSNGIVLDWNQVSLQAIQATKTAPPVAARDLAIVHTAIYDAVNAILKFGKSYHATIKAPKGASAEAAAAGAAYQTLVNLFPTQRATFDAALSASLAKIADGKSEQRGLALGIAVANNILAWRSTDGATATGSYTPPTGDGYWQPTSPSFAKALLPQWGQVTPFALNSGSQFRPAGPPTLNSSAYNRDLTEVASLGRKDSSTRTADQTQIALFWADGSGSYTPPGHWNAIAEQVSRSQHTSLSEDARLFALLNVSMADAGIAAWDAKYTYNEWRPITAIQKTDPTWTPLITTPNFPDYISGHSTFSGAASAVLDAFFGDANSFSTTSITAPGVVRSYQSFATAADEAGRSRIYGGIHVETSDRDGLTTGRLIGRYALSTCLRV